ncbi:MAG: NAD(P)/FAD-dependent oxidoreductase [Acidobacteriaceae bacterium]|nr:NAD(P)/FAD-dependent oxidoreductase [Acidobacteriaceae bacterium]MBV9780600.1 NAD(P)/FAD-dependent oxidoreductase [Acidobacteriaceae bacterium]
MSLAPDVLIVGAGPAGIATALALHRAGFAVAVTDCACPPVDKVCGEGLLPDSIAALNELGVTIPVGVGFGFRGVRFIDGELSATADFTRGTGIGLRRTVLHALLIEHALKAGISFAWGQRGTRLAKQGVLFNGEIVRPKLVVGADGQNSKIRKDAGFGRARREARRFGFRRHYKIAPWSAYAELHWGQRCQLYVTPVSESEVGIAFLSRNSKLRLRDALADFPAVRERLGRAHACSAEAGGVTVSRRLDRVCSDRVALVGDASGSVDAITAEGMGLSFRQAIALSHAFKSGDLSEYERAHRALRRRPAFMESAMLTLARHDALRRRALALLARYPELFARILAIHVGAASLGDPVIRAAA